MWLLHSASDVYIYTTFLIQTFQSSHVDVYILVSCQAPGPTNARGRAPAYILPYTTFLIQTSQSSHSDIYTIYSLLTRWLGSCRIIRVVVVESCIYIDSDRRAECTKGNLTYRNLYINPPPCFQGAFRLVDTHSENRKPFVPEVISVQVHFPWASTLSSSLSPCFWCGIRKRIDSQEHASTITANWSSCSFSFHSPAMSAVQRIYHWWIRTWGRGAWGL